MASHPSEEQFFSFQLSFGEGSELQEWNIHEPVERFDIGLEFKRMVIGVSSPDGIVPLSRALVDSNIDESPTLSEYLPFPMESEYCPLPTESEYLPLPTESEYITTEDSVVLPVDFFFSFHSVKEVRMPGSSLEMEPDARFSLNSPLFHTLKVLNMWSISLSFLADQTFPKLERYKEGLTRDEDITALGPLTEMPVCTRLVVPLLRLATLRLPQIRELDVCIDGRHDHIWENRIAFNANLSGIEAPAFAAYP